MIALRPGERPRCTNKTRNTLTKRKIATFLVSRLTGFLAHRMMAAFGQNHLISLPEAGVGATAAISGRDGLPQPPAGSGTAMPDDKSDDLPSTPTQGCPQSVFVVALIDEGPQLIQFQNIARLLGQQTLLQAWQLLDLISQPFQPTLSDYTEDALRPAQTGPFSIRLQHLPTAFWLFSDFGTNTRYAPPSLP
jgi:hypothetical protein